MAERYARCIVYRDRYRKCADEGDTRDYSSPVASFDNLYDAVAYADCLAADNPDDPVKVIDVENLGLGDMLTSEECARMVATIRMQERRMAAR